MDVLVQGVGSCWIPIILLLAQVLRLSGQLRPDCTDSVEVGFNPRPKAHTELGVATRVGCLHLCLGVTAVRPQPHPALTVMYSS